MNRDNSASVVQLTEEVKQLKAMVNAKNGIFDNIVRLGNVDYPIFVNLKSKGAAKMYYQLIKQSISNV